MRLRSEYFITTPYGRVHTLEKGSGKPVIFLHGWSVNAYATGKLLEKLSASFRVLSPTIPGFAPSLKYKDLKKQDHLIDALISWFDALRLEDVTLIGHSMGGALAVRLAVERGASLKKLILVDSVGLPFERKDGGWVKSWFSKRWYSYRTYGVITVFRYIDRSFFTNAIFRFRDLKTLSHFARKVDIKDQARSIQTPTSILWGDADDFTPIAIGRELQGILPNAKLKIVSGNHDWPLFRPQILLDDI